jgi:hypothetical protein
MRTEHWSWLGILMYCIYVVHLSLPHVYSDISSTLWMVWSLGAIALIYFSRRKARLDREKRNRRYRVD